MLYALRRGPVSSSFCPGRHHSQSGSVICHQPSVTSAAWQKVLSRLNSWNRFTVACSAPRRCECQHPCHLLPSARPAAPLPLQDAISRNVVAGTAATPVSSAPMLGKSAILVSVVLAGKDAVCKTVRILRNGVLPEVGADLAVPSFIDPVQT